MTEKKKNSGLGNFCQLNEKQIQSFVFAIIPPLTTIARRCISKVYSLISHGQSKQWSPMFQKAFVQSAGNRSNSIP